MYKSNAHINTIHHKDGSTSFDDHFGRNPAKCGRCHGTGKRINFKIGLGHDSLVPAYTDDVCEVCGGSGAVVPAEGEHIHYEYDVTDSFLLWLWRKLTK